jgi:hypothetical protein
VHDAHDREDQLVEADGPADDGRVRVEEAHPGSVAEDGDRVPVRRARIEPGEAAPDEYATAECFEVVPRHERREQLPPFRGDRAVSLGDQVVEEILPLSQLVVVVPAEHASCRESLVLSGAPSNLV